MYLSSSQQLASLSTGDCDSQESNGIYFNIPQYSLSVLHSELQFQFIYRDNQESELLNQIKLKLKKI